ncbi:hypothetical protein GWO25_00525 [Candidatus Saccharibacteria bacterium]|nr:hypothetical protein [Candidatus Saccharibacteria bacterium]
MAIIFAYDGYLSKYEWSLRRSFYEKHTNEDGTPDSTLVFNRKSPPFFFGGGLLLGAYWFVIRNKKLIADETVLVFSDKDKIAYDSIQQIDKTYFKKKGRFVITYKDEKGREVDRKISDRTYDNLEPILDHLVAELKKT